MIEKIYLAFLKFLMPLSLDETYKKVVQEAKTFTGAKYGSIFIPDENGGFQRVYTSSSALHSVIPRKDGNTARVFKAKDFYLLKTKLGESYHSRLKKFGVGEDLSIALSYNKINIGVLSLLSFKNKEFDEEKIEAVKLFRPLATLAIRKAILYEELQKSIEARDLFISLAAHELKTPLTSIMIYSQLLEKSVSQGQLPKLEQVEKLLNEEKRLTNLTNELLQINRIRTGNLQFEMKKCDLKEIILTALSRSQKTLAEHTARFYSRLGKSEVWVWGDFDKLLQVVTNLLDNAVKYSPPKSKITLTLKSTRLGLVLEIKDEGIGISEEDLPHVFERFYKIDNKKPGMGLGLYLVSYIVQKHAGKIEIDSELGKGTTVTITLPSYSKDARKRKTSNP